MLNLVISLSLSFFYFQQFYLFFKYYQPFFYFLAYFFYFFIFGSIFFLQYYLLFISNNIPLMIQPTSSNPQLVNSQTHSQIQNLINDPPSIMDFIIPIKQQLKIEIEQIHMKQKQQMIQNITIKEEGINFQCCNFQLLVQTVMKKRENIFQEFKCQNQSFRQNNQVYMSMNKRYALEEIQSDDNLISSSSIYDSDNILCSLQELDHMISSSSSNSDKANNQLLEIISQESNSSRSSSIFKNKTKNEEYKKEQSQNQVQYCDDESSDDKQSSKILSSSSLQHSSTPKIQQKKIHTKQHSLHFLNQNVISQISYTPSPNNYLKNQSRQEMFSPAMSEDLYYAGLFSLDADVLQKRSRARFQNIEESSQSKSSSLVVMSSQISQLKNERLDSIQRERKVNYNVLSKKQFKQEQEAYNFRNSYKFINQSIDRAQHSQNNSFQKLSLDRGQKYIKIKKFNNKRYIPSLSEQQQEPKDDSSLSSEADSSNISQNSSITEYQSIQKDNRSKKKRKQDKRKDKIKQQPNIKQWMKAFDKVPKLINSIEYLTEILKRVANGLLPKIQKSQKSGEC